MNPFVHGEVFVLDDGWEADMDIGTYERFLNENLTSDHNITTGQIYDSVIEKERKGAFLGQCVQIIPHVTDEIKRRIRVTGRKAGAKVLFVECGGTVGDIESQPFLEAFRQMMLEEEPDDALSVHVTLVPKLEAVGEQKTKPTQHSVQELRKIGIQPDVIVARSKEPLLDQAKRKISLFTNVKTENVFSLHDVDEIYTVPDLLEEQGWPRVARNRLDLDRRNDPSAWEEWHRVLEGFKTEEPTVRIAMAGKYVALADSYVSVKEAVRHAAAKVGVDVEMTYVDTEEIEEGERSLDAYDQVDGIIIPGGFGPRGAEGKVDTAEYALEEDIPYLGLCYGCQLAVVMFSRKELGLEGANSTEVDPETPHPVIDLLPEQREIEKKGATMRLGGHDIETKPDTLARRCYGQEIIRGRHRHRYFFHEDYQDRLVEAGMVISGKSVQEGYTEIVEIPGHPYFVGTQFHPEFTSTPERPDGIYVGFIRASLDRSEERSHEVRLESVEA